MARIRTVKPGFFTDEELSELSAETHLFGGGLLCQADDQGYFKATPGILEGAIYPIRECSLSVHEMLAQLAMVRFIRLGTGKDGKRYGQVVTFDEHQRVNRPSPSKISKLQIVWDEEGKTHTQLTEPSPTEGKGIRKGNKEKKQNPPVAAAPVDERKAAIREAVKKGYAWRNENRECPWGPAEEVILSKVLADVPKSYTPEFFVECVRNKFRSDETHGTKPREWLRFILTYADGPIDRFRKPKSLGESGNARKAQINQDQQRDELRELCGMASDLDGEGHPATAVPKQRLLTHEGGKARGVGAVD